MKRLALFTLAFAWLACDTPSAPTTREPTVAGPSFERTHTNESIDVTGFSAFNSCPPEEVVEILRGRLHFNQVVETSPDGTTTVKFHVNAQGIEGVGLITGKKYRVQDNEKITAVFSPTAEEQEGDFRFRLIRQGSLDNLWIRFTFRFTFPPGDFVIIRDEIECRG